MADISLQGNIDALSSINANINLDLVFSGTITSTSGTSNYLILDAVKLDAMSSASSSLTGILERNRSIVGTINGSSTLSSGTLDVVPGFDATVLFWRPQNNVKETLEWKTEILKAHDGTEQRIKIRQSPRQFFKYELFLPTDLLNTWFDSQLHRWLKSKWLVPIWTDFVEHSGTINKYDTTITVDTTNADFRAANKAIIWVSTDEYEVVKINTVANSQLNLYTNYPVLNNYTGTKYIIPVREAYMTMSVEKSRFRQAVAKVNLVFKIFDNINLTGYVPDDNYDGLPLLINPSFMGDVHIESSNPDIILIDYETGTFEIISNTTFNITSQQHTFINNNKAACWNFRKFLYSLNGRQKAVLIPTFRDDLTLVGTIVGGQTTFTVENISLTNNMGFNSLRTYIGFYFPDTGELITRKITNIEEVNSSTERITIDAAISVTDAISAGDCRICFIDKCRLESDKIEIDWLRPYENSCETKFMRII